MKGIIDSCSKWILEYNSSVCLSQMLSKSEESYFKQSTHIPSFFLKNLNVKYPKIYCWHGEPSQLRAVYFLIFKSLEFSQENSHPSIGVVNNFLSRILSLTTCDEIIYNQNNLPYTINELKSFICQFIILLLNTITQQPNCNQHLQNLIIKYPIMDRFLISLIQGLLSSIFHNNTQNTHIRLVTFEIVAKLVGLEYVKISDQLGKGYKLTKQQGTCYVEGDNVFVGYSFNRSDRINRGKLDIFNLPMEPIPQIMSDLDDNETESIIAMVWSSKFSQIQQLFSETQTFLESPKRTISKRQMSKNIKPEKQNIIPKIRKQQLAITKHSYIHNDFTSSEILKFVQDPFKSNIQNIKNRALKPMKGWVRSLF